ncbi:exosome complex component RRP42 [Leptonychotes weddellii]|uniref:Ribosomal RNA-processing protein 42 n=1 Tax=Leptonychotes weddellii TaxID=9713 RepID=A0A2U3YSJ4_LEPWE|nr:exosome complex component RRP42 [Leptonychotes weddellii]
MARRHEAPRLPGLVQTRGGAQEKPIELPAVAAAAVAAGAAAAQADDARARGRGGAVGAGATRADDVRRAGRLGSMASVALSEAEKVYIVHGVQVATPRRQPPGFPWRCGWRRALASLGRRRPGGVLGLPDSLSFSVASPCSSANATPEFEGRGGDDLGTEIANTLYRIFNNKSSVDLKSLCISPREHCWILYVDVLLLECGGNLFDTICIAVKAALFNTRIPRVRVLEDEEGSKDIELSDDPYDCIRLSVENVPCIVTLCKIGYRHVVDATLQEEACSLASLLVSVTSTGVVTCMRKVGKGSLDPESIFEMMETGKRVGKVLHASLQSVLHKEESLGPKRQKVGFLG